MPPRRKAIERRRGWLSRSERAPCCCALRPRASGTARMWIFAAADCATHASATARSLSSTTSTAGTPCCRRIASPLSRMLADDSRRETTMPIPSRFPQGSGPRIEGLRAGDAQRSPGATLDDVLPVREMTLEHHLVGAARLDRFRGSLAHRLPYGRRRADRPLERGGERRRGAGVGNPAAVRIGHQLGHAPIGRYQHRQPGRHRLNAGKGQIFPALRAPRRGTSGPVPETSSSRVRLPWKRNRGRSG